MSLSVFPASTADHSTIIDILVEAFAQDPAFLRALPQPDPGSQRLRALFQLQIEKQYAVAGNIDIARNEEDEIVGVALWDRPDGKHSALDQASILPQLVSIFGVKAAQIVLNELNSARFHPRFSHWYLYTIATAASARGTGVGSALLNHGIDRAGEEAIYLEATSTRAAQLYNRLGFVPLGYIPAKDSGTQELAMWKPPAMPTV
ncbi:GNAT family N-acetyltransferase [Corynebacterium crudilactis]|uniref:GCN5 family acetyltransferase n=1 Tax=Corynebacterium crudilactis TaxID=1652495 RepID=A0A172QTR4_9CORY|nr:GNAT family N-acetyltransferase [Corynebacterium crudilactis]ANE04050.1 GCN5 family acetyltransferase [Corynebacterium crudilactis]